MKVQCYYKYESVHLLKTESSQPKYNPTSQKLEEVEQIVKELQEKCSICSCTVLNKLMFYHLNSKNQALCKFQLYCIY